MPGRHAGGALVAAPVPRPPDGHLGHIHQGEKEVTASLISFKLGRASVWGKAVAAAAAPAQHGCRRAVCHMVKCSHVFTAHWLITLQGATGLLLWFIDYRFAIYYGLLLAGERKLFGTACLLRATALPLPACSMILRLPMLLLAPASTAAAAPAEPDRTAAASLPCLQSCTCCSRSRCFRGPLLCGHSHPTPSSRWWRMAPPKWPGWCAAWVALGLAPRQGAAAAAAHAGCTLHRTAPRASSERLHSRACLCSAQAAGELVRARLAAYMRSQLLRGHPACSPPLHPCAGGVLCALVPPLHPLGARGGGAQPQVQLLPPAVWARGRTQVSSN